MKSLFITTIVALGLTAGAASAQELTWVGQVEYSVETEDFATEVGAEYAVTPELELSVLFMADGTQDDFAYTGAEVTLDYAVDTNVNLFTTVSFDENTEYTDATVGVGFRF